MNLVYRVIFNRRTGAFQAVSEVSKSQGKTQSCRRSGATRIAPQHRPLSRPTAVILAALMGGPAVNAACTNSPFQASGVSSLDSLCINNPVFTTELVGVHSGANLTLSNSTITSYNNYAANVSCNGAVMVSNNDGASLNPL